MQPTALNALAAIVAAPPSQASGNAVTGNADDSASHGQQFSQLLSDSGTQHEGQQPSPHANAAKLLQASAAGALSAQEVTTPAEQIAQLLAAREQAVTPDDAKELITRIDTMAAQSSAPADMQAFAQIKQQLQDIVAKGTPKTVAEILAAAPAVKEAKLSLIGLTALLTSKKTAATQGEPSLTEEEAGASAMATQAVPVQVFRPDAGEAKADTSAAKSDTKKESLKKEVKSVTEDARVVASASPTAAVSVPASAVDGAAAAAMVTVMVPLAASITQPMIVTPAVNATVPGIGEISSTDMMPSPALQPRADLDAVIPPLTSNDGKDELPALNLPKLEDADVATDAATMADAKTVATDKFSALAPAAGTVETAKPEAKPAATAQSDLSAINNLSQTPGAVPTQTAAAVQPVHVIATPGLVNRAPVSDQVSVAVSKASKDGIDHITIQLDPMGLGRVEVNMHTNRDGQTQISFTVDKADTFDSLSRDARHLERSLQEAGIKADTGSMQFNMRQQPQPQQLQSNLNNGQGQSSQQQASADETAKSSTTTSVASVAAPVTRNYLFNVREGVDISA